MRAQKKRGTFASFLPWRVFAQGARGVLAFAFFLFRSKRVVQHERRERLEKDRQRHIGHIERKRSALLVRYTTTTKHRKHSATCHLCHLASISA
jgi:hypothetical protein